MSSRKGPGFLMGAVVGAATGAAAAFLYAPRSGRQTRAMIAAWREANRTAVPDSPRGYVNEALDLGAALLQAGRDRFEHAVEAARQAAAEARQRMLDEWRH